MTERVFFILYPEDSNAPESEVCHLIRAGREGERWDFPEGSVSCCGSRNASKNFDPESNDKLGDDENAIRLYLAKQQNAGVAFCSRCVGAFYSED